MRSSNNNAVKATRSRRGFTVVELMVSVVVAAVAVLVTLVLANGMTRQMRGQRMNVTAQDNARVAIDEITRTLRGAGSGTDYVNGQNRFVYAGPYTVALNANMQPLDDPTGTGEPTALDAGIANPSVPLAGGAVYTPPLTYGTGAETIVLSFDSNRDGELTDADATDDPEEESENPHDFVLKSYVYGKSSGSNGMASTGLALLRGPASSTDTEVEPLFSYWIDDDNDPSTPAVLHGDADGDGRLSATEGIAAGPVPANELGIIERIEVAATAEGEKPIHGSQYPKAVIRSSVSFRNRSTTASRIVGVVFNDVDGDGVRSPNEPGIRDVVIRCSNNTRTKTNTDGQYAFVLTPGIYTITEVDPASFASTTPNQVQVNPVPGNYTRVDFGDVSSTGTRRIVGTVFRDEDADGQKDSNEPGIEGIRLYLDTGQQTHSNPLGRYEFTVQVQDYVITEEDSVNYTSTTPNVVDVNLTMVPDSIVVNFGDRLLLSSGRIHGIVYRDDDNDGVRDTTEPGVPNVSISLDDIETTMTDNLGEFSFTASTGSHFVREEDPPGYTSSTVNLVNVAVVADQTVDVEFGDIAQQDINFQEILLSDTERALSIASLDTGEDIKTDQDLILGTHYVGGRNDILVWWNKRQNSSTPNSSLFTTNADYSRVIAADVNSIVVPDLNGDGRQDVITALGTASNNVAIWLTQGTSPYKGQMPTSPTSLYTASGALSVSEITMGNFDGGSNPDLALGTITGAYTGKLEIWHGTGGAGFSRSTGDVVDLVPGLGVNWGEIVCIARADFDDNGQTDLVVGARTALSASVVYVLLNGPGSDNDFILQALLRVEGSITEVLAVDLKEDDQNDIDVVLSTELTSNSGRVELWHNRGNNHFGFGDVPDTVPDDTADIPGSPLSLRIDRFDNDVFPDLVVGTRTALYSGGVLLYRAYGYLPSSPTVISASDVGEVITVTSADYNKDGAPDLAVGTRNSSTSGKVVIYFNQRPSL